MNTGSFFPAAARLPARWVGKLAESAPQLLSRRRRLLHHELLMSRARAVDSLALAADAPPVRRRHVNLAPSRVRLRLLALAAVLALVALVGAKLAANYLARDQWRPFPLAGTKFQFTQARFFVFNETGHEIVLRVSSSGKLLFEKRLAAKRTPTWNSVQDIHRYQGRYPLAQIDVENYDILTRFLDLTESEYLRRTETVDLDAIPRSDRQGDFSIRVTTHGFKFEYAIYAFR